MRECAAHRRPARGKVASHGGAAPGSAHRVQRNVLNRLLPCCCVATALSVRASPPALPACRDMLTAEMLPLQQAAAAAAAERAAREAAMAAAGGLPGADPRTLQEQRHRVFSSKRNSNGSSSSGRGNSLGASLAASLGLGSSLHTASGSRSRSHSHGRSPAANVGSASGVNSGGSGGTPGLASVLPPGQRLYE